MSTRNSKVRDIFIRNRMSRMPRTVNLKNLEKEYLQLQKQKINSPYVRKQSNNHKIMYGKPTVKSAVNLLNKVKIYTTLSNDEYTNLVNQIKNKLKPIPNIPGFVKPRRYEYVAKQANGEMAGLAIVQNRSDRKTRNLHIIISKRGVGRKIFNKIVNNAKRNQISRIELQAVKSAVPSYKKWGFNNVRNVGKYQIMNYSLTTRR